MEQPLYLAYRLGGLNSNNACLLVLLLEPSSYSHQSSARSYSRHKSADRTLYLLQYLTCRRVVMGQDIIFILVLIYVVVAVALCRELFGRFYVAVRVVSGCEDQLCSPHSHHHAPLDAFRFRHEDPRPITFQRTDHGERYAGIAAGGFYNNFAGREL